MIAAFVILTTTSCSRRQPAYRTPLISGGHAVVEAAALKPDTPEFFTYPFGAKNINFFVIRNDRTIVSFLDACTSCSVHKRGYRYDDSTVTCRYCNMQYPVRKLEKGLGGCYPIRIEGRIENGRYLIPLKTLEAAAEKF